jgi:hypothetical protein
LATGIAEGIGHLSEIILLHQQLYEPKATGLKPVGADGNQIARLANGEWLAYRRVNFGSTQFDARVASGASPGISGRSSITKPG